MRLSAVPLVALLALTAGPARAVENGRPDLATTHAVAIGFGTPSTAALRCSGTLIAPNVVLTVRHCLSARTPAPGCDARFERDLVRASEVVVTAAPDAGAGARWKQASAIVFPNDDGVCGSDLALLVLGTAFGPEEAVPARPVTDAAGLVSATEGGLLGFAGYGATGTTTNDGGVRRSRFDVPIDCVPDDARFDCRPGLPVHGSHELVARGGACSGDSGAGALATSDPRTVFAVLARADLDEGRCGAAVFERVDTWSWLVARTVLASSPPHDVPGWVREVLPEAPRAGQACAAEGACADGSICAVSDGGRARRCATACVDDRACTAGSRCLEGACAGPGATPAPAPVASCAVGSSPTSGRASEWVLVAAGVLAAARARRDRARARSVRPI